MKPVGYLFARPDCLVGDRGEYYDYVFAGNGVFIQASNDILAAQVQISDCPVRGLAMLPHPCVRLKYGSIPRQLFELALNTFLAVPDKEHYIGITANAGYHLYVPPQEGKSARVEYEPGQAVILDLHSHCKMRAFFSGTDDKDESGLKIFGVVGRLDKTPVLQLRVGVYGYFEDLAWRDVFDGPLTGAIESEEPDREAQEEIVDVILRSEDLGL